MKVDMSSEAIDARLKRTSELLNLCLAPGKAKPVTSQPKESSSQIDTTKTNESNNK
jgi:hypothetical protein